LKLDNNKLAVLVTGVSSLFIISATLLIALGKDISSLVGLIPVLVTNLILLVRVDKVEKNTNGNMSKLIDAALASKDKPNER
jgi:hypothetical protein